MTQLELSNLNTFESRPSPDPAPDTDGDRVEPIVTSASEDIMYLHGPDIPKKNQFLAAEIDQRPLLRINPRKRYAEVVVDSTHLDYAWSANAVERMFSVVEPHFAAAQDTPSSLSFDFRRAEPNNVARIAPRGKIMIDGLEIEPAKDLLGELAQVVGRYQDFVYLGEDDFDGRFGPPNQLPREGAPDIHQPDKLDDPFQFAPTGDKSVTTKQIKQYHSDAALKRANQFLSRGRGRQLQYWGDAGHGEMHGEGVSGFCKARITSYEPPCSVYISSGEIVDAECGSDDHDAPCEHTAAALRLAPSVSEHYL